MFRFELVLVLMLASVAHFQDRPSWYTGCINTNECAATECCALSANQYSIASCKTLLEEGAPCRLANQPTDSVVSYPTGDSVNLTNVYLIMCDCSAELTCVEGTCVRNPLKVEPQQ